MYARLGTRPEGLTSRGSLRVSPNTAPTSWLKDQRYSLGVLLWHAVLNPLVILLGVLATISVATGDARSAIVDSACD